MESNGKSIVDVGSSKCNEWLYNQQSGKIEKKLLAPTITSLIPKVKLDDYKQDIEA